jgi:hypothetical protein
MRGAISKSGGNASLAAGRGWFCGGQGVHREMESEGHEEKYRAVIEGAAPTMNRSAKGGARSSLQFGGEGVLIHPPHQGVCGRHGTEEQGVTSGELTRSLDGFGVSKPISESERVSEALSVVGRLSSTLSAVKAA